MNKKMLFILFLFSFLIVFRNSSANVINLTGEDNVFTEDKNLGNNSNGGGLQVLNQWNDNVAAKIDNSIINIENSLYGLSVSNSNLLIEGVGDSLLNIKNTRTNSREHVMGIVANEGNITLKNLDIVATDNKILGNIHPDGFVNAIGNFNKSDIVIEGKADGSNFLNMGSNHANQIISGVSNMGDHNDHSIPANVFIKNMDIYFSDNEGQSTIYGFDNLATSIKIVGSNEKNNKIEMKNNKSVDYEFVGLVNRSQHINSIFSVKNMDIEIAGAVSESTIGAFGIMSESKFVMEGKADGGNNYKVVNLKANNGNVKGIQNKANMDIYNYNYNFSNNDAKATVSAIHNLDVFNYVGNGNNKIEIRDNTSNGGMFAGVLNVNSFSIKDIDIDIKGNKGNLALGLQNDGSMKIEGLANGSNKISITENLSTGDDFYAMIQEGGNLEISNMDIDVSRNKSDTKNAIGIMGYDNIDIKSSTSKTNKLIASGNEGVSGYGILSLEKITIKDMDIEASNNKTTANGLGIGFYGYKAVDVIGSSSRNNMVLGGNSTAGIYTNDSVSVFNIKNMNINVFDNNFALLQKDANLNIENSFLNMDDSKVFVVNDLGANISLNNVVMNKGSGNLLDMTGAGNVIISADSSNITGAIRTTAGSSGLTLGNNSRWGIIGNSNLNSLTANSSVIDLRSSNGGFNSLEVSGNYVANDVTMIMNTQLGGDSSLSDLLSLNGGSASGSTMLDIRGVSGAGVVDEGIKVVDAKNGATIGSGVFLLKGGVVDSGAQEYELMQGNKSGSDTQSMFLRGNGQITDGAKTIAQEPSMVITLARTGSNSLMKRMGELRNADIHDVNGAWARSYAKNMRISDHLTSKITLYGVEGGYDHKFNLTSSEKLYIGGMVGYMYTDKIRTSQNNGRKGDGDGSTPSIGAYATWMTNNGWFVDSVFRQYWEDIKMTSYSSSGLPVKYSLDRNITALSFETGRQMQFMIDSSSKFLLEPKVEMAYIYSKGKSFRDNNNLRLSYGETQGFSTKFAMMFGYNKILNNGIILEPYLQAGIMQEWAGKTNINYDGMKYKSDMSGFSHELGGGMAVKTSNHTSVYSEFMYEKGNINEAFSGNVGFRMTW